MKSLAFASLAAALALGAAPATQAQAPATPPAASAPAPRPAAGAADIATPESLMIALYDVISGPPGPRDWDRFRSLFLPSARMTVVGAGKDAAVRLRILEVEDFVTRSGPVLLKEGFFEKGVNTQILRWGHTVAVRSVYESRHAAADPTPFAGGINTLMLVNDGARWWIAGLMWEESSPTLPVPTDLSR